MSKIEVNTIEPQSGTTITLGASGETVAIASGVALSGFTSTGIDDNATSTAITIDSSQNVGIGTSSPSANLEVRGASSNGQIYLGGSTTATYGKFYSDNDGTLIASADAGNNAASSYFGVEVDGTERMRIDSSGKVGIGTTGAQRKLQIDNGFIGVSESSANSSTNQYNEFTDNSSNWYNTKFLNFAASPASHYMIEVSFSNSSPDGAAAKFFQMADTTTARVNINSDGDIYNHDGTYGTISDERIKQNIVDAGSQWNDIKNIRVRKYKKKHDVIQYGEENAPTEIGVISQELETVSPGLIKEDKADSSHAELHEDFAGENPQNVKYVKYSILYMKSIKALQEAMAKIETLETENTSIKARLDALENN